METTEAPKGKTLSMPTIKRLPAYLNVLRRLSREGAELVSTTTLIGELGLEPMLVRKDLASLGLAGKPRLGYPLKELVAGIEAGLGWNKTDEAFLFGAGSLGRALLGYKPFEENGLKIVAAFDADPAKVGQVCHGKPVLPLSKMEDLLQRMGIKVAVLCVPAEAAQPLADMLVSCGVRGIWNFSAAKLKVPPDVVCHNEDLCCGLAVFTVKMKNA